MLLKAIDGRGSPFNSRRVIHCDSISRNHEQVFADYQPAIAKKARSAGLAIVPPVYAIPRLAFYTFPKLTFIRAIPPLDAQLANFRRWLVCGQCDRKRKTAACGSHSDLSLRSAGIGDDPR